MSGAVTQMVQAEILGKYRVIADLGGGGMARVYLAVNRGRAGFNKLVVLKIIRAELADDPDVIKMFIHEAQLAGRLNHPNVVQTLEVEEFDNRLVMVMEYLEGQSLSTIFKRLKRTQGKMPLNLHLQVLHDALSGLHYAHELVDYQGRNLNIVHRDVSPQNIFVTYDGHTKLLDFGIAKAITWSTETKAGVVKGKLPYMAAEQFLGSKLDRRADIYAMGALLWHAAVGERLWKGVSQAQIMYRVAKGDIPKPEEFNPSVPPTLQRICMRALALEPEARYPTALDLQTDLRAFMEEAGMQNSTREIASLVTDLFSDIREQIREVVKQRMDELENDEFDTTRSVLRLASTSMSSFDPSSSTPSSNSSNIDSQSLSNNVDSQSLSNDSPDANAQAPAESSLDSVHQAPATSMASPTPLATPDQPNSPRNNKIVAIIVLLLLMVGGVVLWLTLKPATSHNDSNASRLSTSTSATPTTTPTSTHDPSTSPETPATVVLKLQAKPNNAKLFLNGKALPSNPVEKTITKSNKTYYLRAEASGYVTETVEFKPTMSQTVLVALKQKAGGAIVARPTRPTHTTAPKPEPTAKPTATTKPKPKPRPTATKKPSVGPLKTDNIDPWAN